MTYPNIVFYLTCLFLGERAQGTNPNSFSSQRQESSFVSANVGESLTLQCFFEPDGATRIYWYKQSLGQKPRLISTLYVFNKNGTFHEEFETNPRFTLDTEVGRNHLKITDLHTSDSAAYFCARRVLLTIEFAAGTIVHVKGSGLTVPASVHQSASEPIQPGGSVTLNCTVHTGTCDGEHSVYWFRKSEESHPGLIYTHGGRNDQCERNSNTQTHTCVYNLPMESLNLSHAGTYYCAVSSCGHILFGNGTKLTLKVNAPDSLVLVYFLSGALGLTTILVVLLAFLVCMMNKRNSYSDSQAKIHAPSTVDAESYQNEDSLHYAALNVNLPTRSRRQRNDTKSECVYSSVKQ
ncbi:uncharacterized protein LOC119911560 [Micropterus salmoides]|uniref:uncharacterized protein LOC119911560 n=1 Tax=Micropterus salmoides TaxID=27706 RepID=UPI0018EC0B76|nr:uncharacterized protein LOC119911560 [Micropterus salmoides]